MTIAVRQEGYHAFVVVTIMVPLSVWQKINELLEDPANDLLVNDLIQQCHDPIATQKEAEKQVPYDVATFSVHPVFVPIPPQEELCS